jgi:DNA-binding transcriptional LysR family regulator
VNLTQVDMNLFVVLHAVLTERSATRAAARLHVTQSAVSNALARLRLAFGDPLVVRTARGLVPTPKALELEPKLREALQQLQSLVDASDGFDPTRSTRRFTIACTDHVALALLPKLAAMFEEQMPQAQLRVFTIDRLRTTNGLATGEVDLVIGIPPTLPSGCSAAIVYEDEMVCVLRRNHPKARGALSLDVFAESRHVVVAVLGDDDDGVDAALARRGRARKIAVSVPHFTVIPMVLIQTNAMATLPRRLAETLARLPPLRIAKCPLDLPVLSIKQVWHARSAADAGNRFLRGLVLAAAGE